MEPDFSGYATKAGLECSDGRTIMPDAFRDMDGKRVPLVWQHGHNSPKNVLGYVDLKHVADGVYAKAFFNKSEEAVAAKELVEHGDITMMSIYANRLIERAKRVFHGVINEVSLVLAGANPGARIENVNIAHGDESYLSEDDVVIFTGLAFMHGDVAPENFVIPGEVDEEELEHAADGTTVKDIYDAMDDDEKKVVHYLIATALEAQQSGSAAHSADGGTTDGDTSLEHQEGTGKMTKNIFEKNGDTAEGQRKQHVLTHSDAVAVVDLWKRQKGSLREAFNEYASGTLMHGVENIDILFPDAKATDDTPTWIKRRTEWVSSVLGGVHKTPFSRVKSLTADITEAEARAKGYVKGAFKKEEFFSVAKRVTTPTTIYKKQKLDRDDVVDITDFDVIVWIKGEMRIMLDEESATAILIGDGREVDDEDKISETNIRPIATDDELYNTTVTVDLDDANSNYYELVEQILRYRRYYKGTGTPTFYSTEPVITEMLLAKDAYGRRYFNSEAELASGLRVAAVVAVETMERDPGLIGIIVNLTDYNVGADKGGEVNLFDDFDLDYNKLLYLIETRFSGALVKPKSALTVRKRTGSDVLATPTKPTFVSSTGVVTIPTITGVVYKNAAGTTLSSGAQTALAAGASTTIHAEPASGYYFVDSVVDGPWTFTRDAA